MIVTVCARSLRASSTAVIGNVTDCWPSGIRTVAGTVASVRSLLESVTSTSPIGRLLRLTVPVAVPPFSLIAARSIVSVSLGDSGVAKFQNVPSLRPAYSPPTMSPVTFMLSTPHHQSFVPVTVKRNTSDVPPTGLFTAPKAAPPLPSVLTPVLVPDTSRSLMLLLTNPALPAVFVVLNSLSVSRLVQVPPPS